MKMNMQNLMAQARKIQGEIEKVSAAIDNTEYEYKNDNIHVVICGNYKVKKLEILQPELTEDKEILEDMLCVGVNNVLDQIKKDKDTKLGKYTGGLGGLL